MATYYVSVSGNDISGSGTVLAPWATLAKAYTSSTTGDTLYLMAGTHTWATATMVNRVIQGAGAATTIVSGASLNDKKIWTLSGTVTVNDLTFTLNGANDGAAWNQCPLGCNSASSVITFNRCILTNISVGGAYYNGTTIGASAVMGAGSAATSLLWTVNGCLFYQIKKNPGMSYCAFFATHQGTAGVFLGTWQVRNSSFNIGETGATQMNVVSGVSGNHCPTHTFTNCIIENTTGATINISGGGMTTIALSYSCYYLISGTLSAANSITASPQFIDAANGDFRLRPTSPCIETGTLI